MKIMLTALAGLCLLVAPAVAQTIPHPEIEAVQVMYKPVQAIPQASDHAAAPVIKVKATANIRLKEGSVPARIYLKAIDQQSQAVVYQVSYAVAAGDVSEQGTVLYHKQGNTLAITNPAIVVLKAYVYELYTEDAAGHKSSVYTITQ